MQTVVYRPPLHHGRKTINPWALADGHPLPLSVVSVGCCPDPDGLVDVLITKAVPDDHEVVYRRELADECAEEIEKRAVVAKLVCSSEDHSRDVVHSFAGPSAVDHIVVDPLPPRHRDAARVALLERGAVAETIAAPIRVSSLRHVLDGDLAGVERAGEWAFSREWLVGYEAELRARIAAADPIDPGVPVPADEWADDVLPLLALERRGAKLYLPGAVATLAGREADAATLERELEAAGLRATKVGDDELARFLEARGRLVRLGDGYAIGVGGFEVARDVLLRECRAAGEIALARFRDLAGVGRRDAQLLLERFDADGLTRRRGDTRVLRRDAARAD